MTESPKPKASVTKTRLHSPRLQWVARSRASGHLYGQGISASPKARSSNHMSTGMLEGWKLIQPKSREVHVALVAIVPVEAPVLVELPVAVLGVRFVSAAPELQPLAAIEAVPSRRVQKDARDEGRRFKGASGSTAVSCWMAGSSRF